MVLLLEERIKRFFNQPSFCDYQGETLLYSDVAKKILFFHRFFKKLNLKAGDKIALIGRNSAHWAIAYFAIISYGAVVVPLLPDFHPDDMQHLLHHSESKLVFVTKNIFSQLSETAYKSVEGVLALDDYSTLYCHKKNFDPLKEEAYQKNEKEFKNINEENFKFSSYPSLKEPAALIYTSGTTGFSKGVLLSYDVLWANVDFAEHHIYLNPGDKILSFLPLSHAYAASFDFLFPFFQGAHLFFLAQIPSPKFLLNALKDVNPSLIFTVPLIIEKIYKKQIMPTLEKKLMKVLLKIPKISQKILNKIKNKLVQAFGGNFQQLVVGGAALNPEVEEFFKKIKFPFTVGYGMTECGPLISYSNPKDHRTYSVGKTIPCLESRIDSPDPENIIGEIQVKGVNIMIEYYKNQEATKEAFTTDGWLKTGDLGVIDKDGFIFIKGRSKNMILGASGQNIYPEEIEALLNNYDYITECMVTEKEGKLIALAYPDFEVVDQRKPHNTDSLSWLGEQVEEIKKDLNQSLPQYCQINKIILRAEPFEKTPTQKIKRFLYQV